MIRSLPWRRRRPDPDTPRSTLTRTSGRFFASTSPWNTPLTAQRPSAQRWLQMRAGIEDVGLAMTTRVVYGGPHDPILVVEGTLVRVPADLTPCDAAVVVDLENRTVVSGTNWQRTPTGWTHDEHHAVSLDDPDGWGSLAAGLVLEREIIAGEIPHTLALETPDPALFGKAVYIEQFGLGRRHLRAGQDAVSRALQRHGGVVVGLCEGTLLLVRCEQIGGSNPGPGYRAAGIGGTHWMLHMPLGCLEVTD